MNLFGLTIGLSNGNGKYVKKEDCHSAMDSINQRIDGIKETMKENKADRQSQIEILQENINIRFEDLKDYLIKHNEKQGR